MDSSFKFCGVALSSLVLAAAQAQTSLPAGFTPSSTDQRGILYPAVSADDRVIFQIKAPNAQSVEIVPLNGSVQDTGFNGLGSKPYAMTKNADGVWSVTTPPVTPGFHYYSVSIDGFEAADPATDTFHGANHMMSGVEVPEKGIDFFDAKNVPHGQIREFWYYSKLSAAWRRIFVYVPPGYSDNSSTRYPVLYLRHGGGEDETGWVKQGHVNFILDNLLAENKMKPMIVVMESGNVHIPGVPDRRLPQRGAGVNVSPANDPAVQVTINETIPEIDSNFRTLADREHRAMAGLSMGAFQTLAITLTHQNEFSAIGAFSRPPVQNFDPKLYDGGVLSNTADFNKKIHVFWFGVGTKEAGIYASLQQTRPALNQAGIHYIYTEYPGFSHEWQVWRKQLHDFAPLLFRW